MPKNYLFGTNGNNGEKVGLDARRNTSLGTHQIRSAVTDFGLLFELLRSLKVFFAGVRRFQMCIRDSSSVNQWGVSSWGCWTGGVSVHDADCGFGSLMGSNAGIGLSTGCGASLRTGLAEMCIRDSISATHSNCAEKIYASRTRDVTAPLSDCAYNRPQNRFESRICQQAVSYTHLPRLRRP